MIHLKSLAPCSGWLADSVSHLVSCVRILFLVAAAVSPPGSSTVRFSFFFICWISRPWIWSPSRLPLLDALITNIKYVSCFQKLMQTFGLQDSYMFMTGEDLSQLWDKLKVVIPSRLQNDEPVTTAIFFSFNTKMFTKHLKCFILIQWSSHHICISSTLDKKLFFISHSILNYIYSESHS